MAADEVKIELHKARCFFEFNNKENAPVEFTSPLHFPFGKIEILLIKTRENHLFYFIVL